MPKRSSRIAVAAAIAAPLSAWPALPSGAQYKEGPPPPPPAASTFLDGDEALARGLVEFRPAVIPDLPDGVKPSAMQTATLSAAADASGCDNQRHCIWTGGYRSGPNVNMVAGYSYNWDWYQSVCSTSGTSGAIWKNCTSSLRNNSDYYSWGVATNVNGSGYTKTISPNGDTRDQLGDWNNQLESSYSYL